MEVSVVGLKSNFGVEEEEEVVLVFWFLVFLRGKNMAGDLKLFFEPRLVV